MTNVTISINEKDLQQARIQALQQGTSLNAVIRDFLKTYIGQNQRFQKVTKDILKQAESSTFCGSGQKVNRDDLYER